MCLWCRRNIPLQTTETLKRWLKAHQIHQEFEGKYSEENRAGFEILVAELFKRGVLKELPEVPDQ